MNNKAFSEQNIIALSHYPDIIYSSLPPFNPAVAFPEFPFRNEKLDSNNKPYSAVREAFHLLEYDLEFYGTARWNPLGKNIKPGQQVLIKPNAVMERNMNPSQSLWAAITHPSIIRAVIDYVYIALKGEGRIIIADAPMAQSDFGLWKEATQINSICDLYKKEFDFDIEVLDLRKSIAPFDWKRGFAHSTDRKIINGDPSGYEEIDLAKLSEFSEWPEKKIRRIYGSDYDTSTTVNQHLNGHHKYLVARTALLSDVIISIPKLKTHGKVGITVNLKGMVGLMGDKNYIPHQCVGPITYGGDETNDYGIIANFFNYFRTLLLTKILSKNNKFADKQYVFLESLRLFALRWTQKLRLISKKVPMHSLYGAWDGNDTAWRMVLDLNRIIFLKGKNALPHKQITFMSIVDGICAGEGAGPLSPMAKNCGVILAGTNPLWVDVVAAGIMGFNIDKIPILNNGIQREWLNSGFELKDIQLNSNSLLFKNAEDLFKGSGLCFVPPSRWENLSRSKH